MSWEAWVLIAWFACNAVSAILLIGRPQPAITPGTALGLILIFAAEAWLIVRLGAS